jgi:hypothetical protein
MSDKACAVWIVIALTIGILLGLAILSACAAPSYDSQGNGTRVCDRLTRHAIHAVNGEHY